MISRFGFSSSSSSSASAPTSNNAAPTAPRGGSITGNYSMSSISSFTGITKKMSDMTASLMSSGNEAHDKKAADDRKIQITQVLSMLEDVHLQIPPNHSGLIIAYTGKNMSPILHPGIKFTWYRMKIDKVTHKAGGSMDNIDDSHKTCWYAPSIDDLGCMICVQCEDNFEQGCAKYLECGPIEVDPLVKSIAENAVNHGSYEAKDVFVSFGSVANDDNHSFIDHSTQSHTALLASMSHDQPPTLNTSIDGIAMHSHGNSSYPSTLARDHCYSQFINSSMIEIDTNGIFISIPTVAMAMGGPVSSGGHNGGLNTSRRGLRIPRNEQIKVSCVQATTLLITLPVTAVTTTIPRYRTNNNTGGTGNGVEFVHSGPSTPTKSPHSPKKEYGNNNNDDSAHTDVIDGTEEDTGSTGGSDEDGMKQFLTSSTITIPWSYEGHHLSPAAYILSAGGSGSEMDSSSSAHTHTGKDAELLHQAEMDSIVFANSVVTLAEFISSLPEGTNELYICLHCSDRQTRDLLALSIRLLVSSPAINCSNRNERRKLLPWTSGSGTTHESHDALTSLHAKEQQEDGTMETTHEGANSAAAAAQIIELKHYTKSLEEENISMKKEQKELLNQLLQSREDFQQFKVQQQKLQQQQPLPSPVVVAAVDTDDTTTEGSEKSTEAVAATTIITADQNEEIKQLTMQVREYEYKLSVAQKKQNEFEDVRHALETHQSQLQSELDTVKHQHSDLQSKHAVLHSLNEQMKQSLMNYETQQDKHMKMENDLKYLQGNVEEFTIKNSKQKDTIADLKKAVEQKEYEIAEQKVKYHELFKEYEDFQQAKKSEITQQQITIDQLEQQMGNSAIEMKRLEREVSIQQELYKRKEQEMADLVNYPKLLTNANDRYDILQGEYNHLLKKLDSQTKDMKRVMKENASTCLEFEKALARKSGECNELYFQLEEYRDLIERNGGKVRLLDDINANNGANGGITEVATEYGGRAIGEASAMVRRLSSTLQQTLRPGTEGEGESENPPNSSSGSISGFMSRGRTPSVSTTTTASGNASGGSGVATNLFRRFSLLSTNNTTATEESSNNMSE